MVLKKDEKASGPKRKKEKRGSRLVRGVPSVSTRARNFIGPKIKELRNAAKPKITLDDLVARLETRGLTLNRSMLAKIERQERSLVDFEIAALASALRIPVELLFKQ